MICRFTEKGFDAMKSENTNNRKISGKETEKQQEHQSNAYNSVSLEEVNHNHNVKKQALGPNTKR